MAELLDRAHQAVSDALAAGATGAWARAASSRSTETVVRDGKVEKVQSATSRNLSLQIYADGRYSAHSTTDLVPERLAHFVADAVAMTKALPVDPFREMPDPALFAGRASVDLGLVDSAFATITPEEREAWALAMEAAGRTDPRVISATASVADDADEGAAASSNGFEGTWAGTSGSFSADVTVRDAGDRRPEGSWYTVTRSRAALPDPKSIGEAALARALLRLGATKGPTKRMTMVVDPQAGGNLVNRLLGPATASLIFQGRSFWGGKVGQKLLSPKFTLTDDPLRVGGFGSRLFDGEGIAAKPRAIIENGVLSSLYVDTYYGKKAKLAVTSGSPSNRVVKLGDKALPALLAQAGSGLYVTSWLGGNADPTTLDFSLGVRGHLIEHGKAGAPVAEMNVTGNLATLFASLVAVGNDPWLPSSLLVPTLVFENVQVGGA
jgi:PmbA protein